MKVYKLVISQIGFPVLRYSTQTRLVNVLYKGLVKLIDPTAEKEHELEP